MMAAPYHQNRKGIREAGCTECGFIKSYYYFMVPYEQ
jgi:hypothetical protein